MNVFHKVFFFLDQEEHYKKFMKEAYQELIVPVSHDEQVGAEVVEPVEVGA